MNEKVLKVLEYNKIIEMLVAQANSDPGRKVCSQLLPMTDMNDITKAQTQTADAIARIFQKGSTSFGSNTDVSGYVRALKIGASLDAAALLKIASMLENVARIKNYGRRDKEETPADSLTDMFDGLEPLTPIAREIRRCIISEEEIASDASPALAHVRRSIALTGDRIHDKLNSMVNGSMHSYLQDNVITMRDDRYCLPVRAEFKSQVSGIVHDQSSSGSTLFIEPQAIVELNNKLREFMLEEQKEIEKILAELSVQTGEYVQAISDNAKLMTELDFIFAKASLALSMNATTPIMKENHGFNIRKGRHPLIDKNKVVPIDVYCGGDFNMLIITGPNTGGKTVTLKTVGLLTLMGQSGLAIPAGDRSELSIFDEVYADIGDEQSIEQSLSTFSSHMTNEVKILNEANENSLCLFDELGAGTDPTEGAALAISILNDLHKRGITTMATTHYAELKVYALSTEGVKNASCEFDVETLRPTYKLLIGVPGKSNAFAISSKLGLPDRIIEAAKEQIGSDDKRFEDLLSDLEKNRVLAEKERTLAERYRLELSELKKSYEKKADKLDTTRDEILRRANEEARDILADAKKVADETIKSFRKAGKDYGIQELDRERSKLNKHISDKNQKLSVAANDKDNGHKILKESQIRLGDSVKIVSMGLKGTVSSMPDKSGNMFVQCGIIRTKTNIRDIVLVADDEEKKINKKFKMDASTFENNRSQGKKLDLSKGRDIRHEVNLIGLNSDDAIHEMEQYLDQAYMSHLPSVRVVHGKGAGILRQAVQQRLRQIPYVKSFKLGEYGEGDAGVTIVTFK
ncbi:DNA mismatch repair protein MutS2 [Butyrivibrio fibrisolvens DSM 3071]|uniref:Endonuclease MutS2 n=1 Tax=Butyrivibrio fibrisolvens DSM 3071 TaxID=1121131 RepID=A0A1M5UYD3_BUTFI|nr:endonuclease MutS2 [Butyrivibrio fibrisolvens]SHH68005.1 DNA mismatch repair protein MutS2 [Butyrivibrio fibrisolvens DSM 3071]